ncbi:MAG: VTT domain-containing protein [Acidobacteria bacterium]|nr:VTT domain-containing protein [Acidobacteriota bacterium]
MHLLALILVIAARSKLVSTLASLGLAGLALLSTIDASFVPLPVPGAADLLIAIMAARSHTWLLLTCVSTIGSIVGGAACFWVGELSGISIVEKRVPAKYFKRMTGWVENHAHSSVAIPAILPPPFPLIPFVLAAGALKMPRKKFFVSFTISRFIRHAAFALLGMHYSRHLVFVYRWLESPGAVWALVIFWIVVIALVTFGIVRLVRTVKQQRRISRTSTAAA